MEKKINQRFIKVGYFWKKSINN